MASAARSVIGRDRFSRRQNAEKRAAPRRARRPPGHRPVANIAPGYVRSPEDDPSRGLDKGHSRSTRRRRRPCGRVRHARRRATIVQAVHEHLTDHGIKPVPHGSSSCLARARGRGIALRGSRQPISSHRDRGSRHVDPRAAREGPARPAREERAAACAARRPALRHMWVADGRRYPASQRQELPVLSVRLGSRGLRSSRDDLRRDG